jgi:RNA polymerase sigma-70 factor (ECF subfamily)
VDAGFRAFVDAAEPKLRAAFVSHYGHELGRDATAEALAYAWANWDQVSMMANPAGYLFRVGQSRIRPLRRGAPPIDPVVGPEAPWIEPGLARALVDLPAQQRAAVVLAHGYGYTHAEIAELLGIRRSSVQNHIERAMKKLRGALEVSHDDR